MNHPRSESKQDCILLEKVKYVVQAHFRSLIAFPNLLCCSFIKLDANVMCYLFCSLTGECPLPKPPTEESDVKLNKSCYH